MSSGELVGILVMLNNYFHDLAVAFLFASMLLGWLLSRRGVLSPAVWRGLNRWSRASLAWVLIGGVIRAVNYRQYEWLEAVGRAQVPALVLKHFLLAGLVAVGLYLQLRIGRRLGRG
jgi:hypothetical protein